jgi:hypothetical protein
MQESGCVLQLSIVIAICAGHPKQKADRLTFDGLARDVQRLVADNPALELDDLARAATTSKFFREVASERCAAEEHWLAQAAVSLFGERFIELLLFVLTDPVDDGTAYKTFDLKTFDLKTGGPFPSHDDLRGPSLVTFYTVVQGPNQRHTIMWSVDRYRRHKRLQVWVIACEGGDISLEALVLLRAHDEVLVSVTRAPNDLVIPFLGLSLLAFKHVRAMKAMTARRSFETRRPDLPVARKEFLPPVLGRRVHYTIDDVYRSVQRFCTRPQRSLKRAMNVLRMVAWRSHSGLLYFHDVMPLQLPNFDLHTHT